MAATPLEQNKTLVLKAFDMFFNKRDYLAAEQYWSATYIQHIALIRRGAMACSISSAAFPPRAPIRQSPDPDRRRPHDRARSLFRPRVS
jgi:predicted SnoaL-like aldol condensation-catalyzing enzyme